MSRVIVHIDRVIISSPDFDRNAFATAIRDQVAARMGSATTARQIGVVRMHSSPDARSVGSAVGDAVGRSLR